MRVHNWHVALAEEIEAAKKRPFCWGHEHDCIQFAARCVAVVTGVDHRAAFPGYASKEEALHIIAAHGSLTGLISSVLCAPIHQAFVGRGDVVLVDCPEGDGAGICTGNVCFVALAPMGLAPYPRSAIRVGWRV